jgi:hypothetical protein
MDAYTYLKRKQIEWARRRGIQLEGSEGAHGEQAYCPTVQENLCSSLCDESKCEYAEGDGNELGSKIRAVHSSSAAAVNLFEYWRRCGVFIPIANAVCIPSGNIISLNYEAQLPIATNVDRIRFRQHPNVDVVVRYDRGPTRLVGIECKFTEAYSSRGHAGIRPPYLEWGDLWTELRACRKLAETISPVDNTFRHLHAAQLLKHILGLKHACCGTRRFRLVYIWHDAPFGSGYLHRKEIEAFGDVARADGILFQAITYQEVILYLAGHWREQHRQYVDYLTERYL